MGKKQVTFADIAEYTHFSKTTISRYFNHPDSLTLENQEKISQALEDYCTQSLSSLLFGDAHPDSLQLSRFSL